MVVLPEDGEPETGLLDDDDDNAIIVRNEDGIVVQIEEEFNVTKLSNDKILELLAGASEAADPSGEVGVGDGGQEGQGAPPTKKPKVLGQRFLVGGLRPKMKRFFGGGLVPQDGAAFRWGACAPRMVRSI